MIRKIAFTLRNYLIWPVLQRLEKGEQPISPVEQKSLMVLYRQHYQLNNALLRFKDIGFRVHSQHEEDGILLYIFSLIGTTNKRCVELCAGNGIECNTANLVIHHRWIGLMFDGDEKNVEAAKKFYSANLDTKYWPPTIAKEWITRGNINRLIQENGFNGEIDLLSLDIDGVDYWLWEEISCIAPRVVVLEFNHLWGSDVSVTVPYRDDFRAEFTCHGSDYAGASLKAFVKLGRKKGYRLVGTNAIATNAFFIRNEIGCDWLPEIDASSCFNHPRAQFGMKERLPGVKNKEWVEV